MDKIKVWYVFRIDDIAPWMNWTNFEKIEKIFDKYWVKPIIWVVPDNQDFKIWNNKYNQGFWNKIKKIHDKWWTIAQHWYQHKYMNTNGWILKINKKWEFAWLPYDKQFEMIKSGKDILEKNLWFKIKWRMAPAHSFDITTCKILKVLWFEYITDWLDLYPFTKYWLKWLPQQIWKPMKKKYWIRTICLHINQFNNKFVNNIDTFLINNQKYLTFPEKLDYKHKITLRNKILLIIFKTEFYLKQLLYKVYIYFKNRIIETK